MNKTKQPMNKKLVRHSNLTNYGRSKFLFHKIQYTQIKIKTLNLLMISAQKLISLGQTVLKTKLITFLLKKFTTAKSYKQILSIL